MRLLCLVLASLLAGCVPVPSSAVKVGVKLQQLDDQKAIAEKALEEAQELLPEVASNITEHALGVHDRTELEQIRHAAEVSERFAEAAGELSDAKKKQVMLKAAEATNVEQLDNLNTRTQKKLTETAAHLTELKATDSVLGQFIEKLQKQFLKEQADRVVDPRDVPRAILSAEQRASEKKRMDKLGKGAMSLECPYTCDPSFCSNKPDGETQCYQIRFREEEENERICEKFSSFKDFECPPGYLRCASVVPDKGLTYKFYASDPERPLDQPLMISGRNLQRCLRVYIVPPEDSCEVQDVATAFKHSTDVMGLSGSPSHPTIQNQKSGKQWAVFKKLNIFKEGLFNLCLLQFREDPAHEIKFQILGTTQIGTVNATRKNTVLKAAQIAEDEAREKNENLDKTSSAASWKYFSRTLATGAISTLPTASTMPWVGAATANAVHSCSVALLQGVFVATIVGLLSVSF